MIGPAVLRELEGAIARDTTEDTPALGLFFSTSGFSKGTLWGSRTSQRPLILVHLQPAWWTSEDDDRPPRLVSILENPPARRLVGDTLVVHRKLGCDPIASFKSS